MFEKSRLDSALAPIHALVARSRTFDPLPLRTLGWELNRRRGEWWRRQRAGDWQSCTTGRKSNGDHHATEQEGGKSVIALVSREHARGTTRNHNPAL